MSAPDSSRPPTSPKTGLHLKRPCLVVADLQRSLQLYQQILGFQLDYQAPASPESYLYTVFQLPKQAQLTFATLSSDYEPRAIALTEVRGVPLPPPTPPYRIGLVIQVSDLGEAIAQIHALNLTVVPPSQFTAPPNRQFTEQGFWDFDGHLIILYQVRMVDGVNA